MAINAIRAQEKELMTVILNKCQYYEKTYIFPTQETLLNWYNQASRRKICIRTLNYMLRRLEDGFYIERVRRQWKDADHKYWFRSTLYRWGVRGKISLERLGIKAFKIIGKIQELMDKRKKEISSKKINKEKYYGHGKESAAMRVLTDKLKGF